jgi:tetratricopeptide (TPR) repeat protein
VLAASPLKRLPDFSIGWGSEADSLYARLSLIGAEIGDRRLWEAMRTPESRPAPVDLAALAASMLENAALEGSVMVIDHLEHLLRGDGTFHREGRLELLMKTLLLSKSRLRLVFLSTLRVRFYREGEGVGLPVMELGGLKGKDLHPLFESWRVEEFPREHFGDIINRVHGHPFAARMFAISVRDLEHRDDLLDNKRYFQMESLGSLEPIARRIAKGMEGLTEEERKALLALAHFRLPFSAIEMESVGVDRKMRLLLQAKGLLDQTPDEGRDRLFTVHPLVIAHIEPRDRSDFVLVESLGNAYIERAEKLDKPDPLLKQALQQEGNRYLFEAHRIRNRARVGLPDNDPAMESIRGMIRGKRKLYDLAEQRLVECTRQDPANVEMHLLLAELMIELRAPAEKIAELFHDVQNRTPTPEVFHAEATWQQQKPAGRTRAAAALERGLAVFPESGRMRRRLAGIYLDQGRMDDAITQLNEAMLLEPMMPDTYGIIGELYLHKGQHEQAEQALSEARRLDPDNGLHMARLGGLLVELGNPDRQVEAAELLEQAVQRDRRSYLAHFYLARALMQRPDADPERADWLLKQAIKLDDRASAPLIARAKLAIGRDNWKESNELLDRATQIERGPTHDIYATRAALYEAQGLIFHAHKTYQLAFNLCLAESKARPAYQVAMARLEALIESGDAIEIQKLAEEAGMAPAAPIQPRAQQAAQTTQRKKGRNKPQGRGGKDSAGSAGAEAGSAGEVGSAGESDAGDAGESESAESESAEPDAGGAEGGESGEPDNGGEDNGGEDNGGEDNGGEDNGGEDNGGEDNGQGSAGEYTGG